MILFAKVYKLSAVVAYSLIKNSPVEWFTFCGVFSSPELEFDPLVVRSYEKTVSFPTIIVSMSYNNSLIDKMNILFTLIF